MLDNAVGKIKGWLFLQSEDRRRAPRSPLPELVVHCWDASAPEGRSLRDISETGAYIVTQGAVVPRHDHLAHTSGLSDEDSFGWYYRPCCFNLYCRPRCKTGYWRYGCRVRLA
jgi:hypothetical protein